jgi:hypothetical protein
MRERVWGRESRKAMSLKRKMDFFQILAVRTAGGQGPTSPHLLHFLPWRWLAPANSN